MTTGALLLEIDDLRRKWGWLFVLGISMVILGTVALFIAPAATLGTVLVLGWLLVVAAFRQGTIWGISVFWGCVVAAGGLRQALRVARARRDSRAPSRRALRGSARLRALVAPGHGALRGGVARARRDALRDRLRSRYLSHPARLHRETSQPRRPARGRCARDWGRILRGQILEGTEHIRRRGVVCPRRCALATLR